MFFISKEIMLTRIPSLYKSSSVIQNQNINRKKEETLIFVPLLNKVKLLLVKP